MLSEVEKDLLARQTSLYERLHLPRRAILSEKDGERSRDQSPHILRQERLPHPTIDGPSGRVTDVDRVPYAKSVEHLLYEFLRADAPVQPVLFFAKRRFPASKRRVRKDRLAIAQVPPNCRSATSNRV